MKKIIAVVLAVVSVIVFCSCNAAKKEDITSVDGETKKDNTEKILVIYYGGNDCIKAAADFVAESTGADVIEVKSKKPYPEDKAEFEKQIQTEHKTNARPAYTATKGDPDDYDIIFIGYPLWDNTLPMPLLAYLEDHKVKNKAMMTFTISADEKSGESLQDIADAWHYSQIVNKYVFRDEDFENWKPVFDLWFTQELYW